MAQKGLRNRESSVERVESLHIKRDFKRTVKITLHINKGEFKTHNTINSALG
jgi:hypothetical protein